MNEFKKERDERKIASQRKIFYTGIFFRVLGGIGLVYQLLALKAGTTAQIVVFLLFSGCRVE
jgi:membrane protein implicated in regulation of membrane protease activity